jgi:hypothetical protein
MDFHEIWYLRNCFRKSVEKIQVSLKSDKNNGTLHEDLCTFMITSRWILLRMRNISDKTCWQNQNTHFTFNNVFRKSCRLWDNVEKYGTARQATDDNIIRRMRFACWVTNATDTHSEYVILIAFTRQKIVKATRLNVTLYVHCLPCQVLTAVLYRIPFFLYTILRRWVVGYRLVESRRRLHLQGYRAVVCFLWPLEPLVP